MSKENYLELQSKFIDLFAAEPKRELKQVDINSCLSEIEFKETADLKDYFTKNSTKQTVENYILSLGNQLNLYPVRISKLRVWNKLFENCENDDEKIFIHQDRLFPLSILLLTEPNVIKNRIAFFYLTSLDGEFKISDFDKRRYSVKQLDKKFYKDKAKQINYDLSKIVKLLWNINRNEIKEFRDKYTHKIAPNIGLGHFTEYKTVTNGELSAALFETTNPTGINEIINLAEAETDNLFLAFEELINFFSQITDYT